MSRCAFDDQQVVIPEPRAAWNPESTHPREAPAEKWIYMPLLRHALRAISYAYARSGAILPQRPDCRHASSGMPDNRAVLADQE